MQLSCDVHLAAGPGRNKAISRLVLIDIGSSSGAPWWIMIANALEPPVVSGWPCANCWHGVRVGLFRTFANPD